MTGLYYYKLVSPYQDDITKNCKLNVNEIDSNFFNLKSMDIKDAKISEDEKTLILIKNNGDEITVDMPYILEGDLEGLVSNLDVEWDQDHGKVTITWNQYEDGEIVDKVAIIDGLLTDVNIITDRTLVGNGSRRSLLRVNPTEQTGFYSPVKMIIDTTEGDKLPEDATVGDRYLTKEYVSDYGYLYNFDAVEEMQTLLEAENSEWRLPSKADWDKLLNSLEPCGCHEMEEEIICHDSEVCHKNLGLYAGKKIKSKEAWKEWIIEQYHNEDGLLVNPVQPVGIDSIGFHALPAGMGNDDMEVLDFTEKTGFWTTTHIKTPQHPEGDPDQDIYTKILDYRKTGVLQEALCPDEYLSVRLVKDFDGTNDYGCETILGSTYDTLFVNETNQIWTKTNMSYQSDAENSKLVPNGGVDIDKRIIYYINVFNGEGWYKKALIYGDAIIINQGEEHENEEVRVFIDDNGDQQLLSTDDVVFDRILEKIEPIIDAIDEKIDNEIADRQAVDEQLWNAINTESETREAEDNRISSALEQETSDRIAVDNQQWDAINTEAETREAEDNRISAALEQETADRIAVDNQQWDAINAEAETREAEDNRISAALEQETNDRITVDNQQWEAINNEIARAQSEEARIEAQLIDNSIDYVIEVNNGDNHNITLKSKGGTNDVSIDVNWNFGEI